MKVKPLSRVRLFATPWTAASHVPPSMGFSRQEYWIGLPFPSPGDLPESGIEPESPALQVDALPSKPPGKHIVNYNFCHTEIQLLHFATFFFFLVIYKFSFEKKYSGSYIAENMGKKIHMQWHEVTGVKSNWIHVVDEKHYWSNELYKLSTHQKEIYILSFK